MPSATTTTNGYDEEFLADRILNFAHNEFARNGSNFSGLNVHNNNNNHGYPSGTQKIYTTEKDFDSLSDCVTRNSPQHPSINQFYSNKYSNGMANSAFSTPNPGSKIPEDFHSLQNSPRYDRLYSYTSSVFCVPSNGTESTYPSRRPPQVELFPQTSNNWGNHASTSSGAAGYPFDRTFFISVARNKGFIVGPELEHIKENSRRSTSHTYGRISAHFRNKYGETEAKTKASYLQIGVRVPSKDHVSEIVGKGGQKIKLIREETGALITTPGENEDHVFIIEAPPEIALKVGDLIATRAQEISQSKANASERRRGSTTSIPGCTTLFNGTGMAPSSTSVSGGQRLISRSPDDLPNGTLPSPSPLLKTSVSNGANYASENGFFSSTVGLSNGGTNNNNGTIRTLLARSKISVPQDMVGKIIGTQGSIITTIQKDTGTEIKSPPKEAARGPNATSEFEISAYQSPGMTLQDAETRVLQAKQLIAHLVMRQFERRSLEDLDDNGSSAATSGKSRNNSNSEVEGVENLKSSMSNGNGVSWMWPDVPQMDTKEVQAVLDRILAESKSKTRRVKEIQATGSTAGSLPASPCGLVAGGNNNFSVEFFPPSEKSGSSCQNSPFHQSRMPSHSNVFSANSGTAANTSSSMNLFERRLANADFHGESEFSDSRHHAAICPSPLFWSNNAGPRHSFSAGAPAGVCGSGASPPLHRRHTMTSGEPYRTVNGHGVFDIPVDKHPDVEYSVLRALETLDLGNDEIRGGGAGSCQDHPPGFPSHFQPVRHQSSSSAVSSNWPLSSFFSASESQDEGATARSNNIWSNMTTVNPVERNAQSTTVATKAASISSSSTGSVNRCGIIGEERRRPSPSDSNAPTSAQPELSS